MGDLSREEFLAHVGPIRDNIAELVRLQREANGRMGKAEVRIAVLEDRSPGRVGMISGSIGAGAIAVVWELLRYFAERGQ
jgi:hypothetical protein